MNVLMYLRKSRADLEAELSGAGNTLARHRRTLTDLAARCGYTIGAEYEEVVSGDTIAARPKMRQLLHEVEAGQWDAVLVMEIERLARGDSIDQGIVARSFRLSETKIITPSKIYDPTNEFDEEFLE
ncbi:MAG: recombinase family protein, partial [Sporomusa sp.]